MSRNDWGEREEKAISCLASRSVTEAMAQETGAATRRHSWLLAISVSEMENELL